MLAKRVTPESAACFTGSSTRRSDSVSVSLTVTAGGSCGMATYLISACSSLEIAALVPPETSHGRVHRGLPLAEDEHPVRHRVLGVPEVWQQCVDHSVLDHGREVIPFEPPVSHQLLEIVRRSSAASHASSRDTTAT